jgi:hypothetical protein
MGQGTSGTISGRATDPQGAALSGATVVFQSLDFGMARQVSTDSQGYYRVAGLPPGRYQVRAELSGFSLEKQTVITLTVAQESVVDLILGISPVSEELTIKGDDGTIDRSSSTLSGLVDEKTVRNLPLNGRDLGQLVLLQPGVVPSRSSVSSANNGRGTQFSVSGSRPNQNLFILDGTILNDALNTTPGSAQGLLLGVETIKEFRVLTNTYTAEYGRATGGVFVAATKSGTNLLHGTVFNFLRNDALDTRNFFDRDRPEFRRNQFGFTAGGPIIKDKTFFFLGYEGLREAKGITTVSIVPDDQARLGRLPGRPATTVDPRSRPILDLFPRANGDNLGDGTAEFIGTTNRISRDDLFTARMDHRFSNSDSIFFRYSYEDSDQVLPRNFPEFPNQSVNRKQSFTIEEQKIISPNVVNEIRFGFNRATPAELVSETEVPLQLISGRPLGEISVSGLTEIGTDRTNPKLFFLNDFQIMENLSLILGKHYLRIGALFERFQYNGNSETRTRGQLRFSTLADLLRFKVQDLQGASTDSDFIRGYRQSLVGLYIQDDLKLSTRLTLNLGLRYEAVTTPREVNGKVSNLRDILDKEVKVGDPLFERSMLNFAPRVGFAYDASGNGKTAIRGGFGIFHDQTLFHLYRSPIFRSLPFVNRGRLRASDFSSLPVDPSLFKGVDQATEAIQFDLRPSYVMQYNLNIQQEIFSGTVLSIAYVGSRGINLIGVSDINTAIPQILPDGRQFFPEGSKRRNPKFDAVRSLLQGYTSSYNSINVGLIKQFSRGLRLQTSYTWGRSIDDASGNGGRQTFSNGQARTSDPYNRRLDRARSNFDVKHSFVANATYELPFGQAMSGLARQLLAGWQINTIVSLYSGVPFTPFVSGDPDRDGTDENTTRPDLVPGVSLTPSKGSSANLWFNPSAFAPPQVGFRGTSGRNILTGPNFRSVELSVVKEFRIGERFQIQFRAEAFNLFNRVNFDLPANAEDGQEIFRYLPPSGGRPGRFESPASVGKIFGTVGDSREIQFGLKFIF